MTCVALEPLRPTPWWLRPAVSAPTTLQTSNPTTSGTAVDPVAERAKLASIEARIEFLKIELEKIGNEIGRVSKLESEISALMRTKLADEQRLKHLQEALQQATVDSALTPNKDGMPNISVIQEPSPFFSFFKERALRRGSELTVGFARTLLIEW